MITEEYVSFETSKLLKEKGFDIPVYSYYSKDGELHPINEYGIVVNFNSPILEDMEMLSAPTQTLAYKWLREKQLLNIDISIQNGGTWNYGIEDIACPFDGGIIPKHWDDGFKTYEEALEAGIQYCLKNLKL